MSANRTSTFDVNYVAELQRPYFHFRKIPEQTDVSRERLLHLAPFCLAEVATTEDDVGDVRHNEREFEIGLELNRKLSLLCEGLAEGREHREGHPRISASSTCRTCPPQPSFRLGSACHRGHGA